MKKNILNYWNVMFKKIFIGGELNLCYLIEKDSFSLLYIGIPDGSDNKWFLPFWIWKKMTLFCDFKPVLSSF